MRERIYSGSNDCAVSETIGFIIIFGIMLTGISLVTLYGYPMLVQEQQNANIRNMERNMIVLQNDLKGLTYKNVPYQETMLQVSGGTLLIPKDGGLSSTFEIDIDGDGTPDYTFPTGGIIFNSQDGTTTICLENGAVHTRFWSSPQGSAMLSEPRWFYDYHPPENTYVMTFITMNATRDFAQTGIGTVAMSLTEARQISPPLGLSQVTVTYIPDQTNNFKTAWYNYFNSPDLEMTNDPTYSGTGCRFKLPANMTNLVIKQYNVTVLSL
jgi:hypothetical protein